MKKILLVLAILFTTTISVGHAQDSWNEGGLSEGACRWMNIQLFFPEPLEGQPYIEKWKLCANDGSKCVNKFCSGVPDVDGYWDKDACNKYCINFQEQLPIQGHKVRSISGDSGVDLLSSYFSMWYKFGALVLGLIAVLVIVISGVQMSIGGVSEESVTEAKTRIMAAILSLILLFSSALILNTINPQFFT